MSILMEVLQEELDRLDRQQVAYKSHLRELPRGYISKKKIRGKESYYLQYREGAKIVSKWIPAANLQEVEKQVDQRKMLEASLRRVKEDQKKLRRALGLHL